jgi:cellulose synthase (UDP-forming)
VAARMKDAGSRSGPLASALIVAGKATLAAVGVLALLLVVVTPLELRNQVLFGAGVLVAAIVLDRLHKGRLVTLASVLIALTISTRYLFWRLSVTLTAEISLETALGIVLLCAELYAFAMLVLGNLQVLARLPRKPAPLPAGTHRWPTIDVLIPTYDEPLAVVRSTVLAARAMDWPSEKLRVFILDDGRRDAFRAFAASAGVGYIAREDNRHAKAGNLNNALARTKGELIAIFDCDHVPTRSFLQMTVGWFLQDRRLSMLQTPHHFYSADPFERNLGTFRRLPNEGELFYGLIQPSQDTWNAAFFCGSCAVLRRTALEEAGGIAVDTVTEDCHTALRMQRLGWNTAYLDIAQAAGLATESLSAHVNQRIRWARGMAQIFRLDNPLLGRGLSLMQRLSYLASTAHFFYGIPRLIFLIAPISYPLFGLHIFNALPLTAVAFGLPHLLHSTLTTSRQSGSFRYSFWSEVYETCLAFYIAIPTTVALFAPAAGKFNVTQKGGKIEDPYFEKRIAQPYLVLAALNLAAFCIGGWRLWTGHGEVDVLLVNLIWCAWNLTILAATLAVAWEQRQLRESPRVQVQLPAMVQLKTGRTLRARTLDLARGGASVRVGAGFDPQPGEQLTLSLFGPADERPLPAEVIDCHAGILRLRFGALSIEEESALVQSIFSRADAWVDWRRDRPVDHPLLSYGGILMRGFGNVAQMLRARPPAPRPSLAGGAPPAGAQP